ncbi:MAG: Xaa-Pro peptidase family protein [Acidobacteria bacterium]|nr:Xaa-Pro peptidase family protein [Acidobacteriota bacterium]
MSFDLNTLDLAALGVEAFLTAEPSNVRYLTGFTGSNGLVVLEGGRMTLFTDPRYTIQAAAEYSGPVEVITRGGLPLAAAKLITRRKLRKVGFEKNRLSYAGHAALTAALDKKAELVALDDVIETRRMVKTPEEIAKIRRSVNLNSQAYLRALQRFRPAMTEAALAAEIDYQMRRLGAEGPAFDTIVASGARTAFPHAHPEAKPIQPNQLLLVDMGAMVDGYASDMTRTLAVGKVSGTLKRMYAAVLEAQLAAIARVKPGVSGGQIDRAAREVLKGHGLDQEFVHSTGHGLGLEIHEGPRLGKSEKRKLEAGMVITIEPGVYRAGVGGVRIEDTVLVTATGPEVLTPTSKELMSI